MSLVVNNQNAVEFFSVLQKKLEPYLRKTRYLCIEKDIGVSRKVIRAVLNGERIYQADTKAVGSKRLTIILRLCEYFSIDVKVVIGTDTEKHDLRCDMTKELIWKLALDTVNSSEKPLASIGPRVGLTYRLGANICQYPQKKLVGLLTLCSVLESLGTPITLVQ